MERIKYDWKETGKLEIEVDGNESATVRFFPSEKVIAEALHKAKFSHSQPSNSQATNPPLKQ